MGKEIPAREKDRRAGARVSKRADSGGGGGVNKYAIFSWNGFSLGAIADCKHRFEIDIARARARRSEID